MELAAYLALILALGVLAQWMAWRSKLPGILLLLVFGILLGQFIRPDDLLVELTGGDPSAGPRVLFPLVSLSVAVILFEGGLSLRLSELRESGRATFRLVTIGALLTMAMVTLAAHWLLEFPWRLSLLLGAILTVTGPTVIGPLLRQIRPTRRVAATVKWEGIVIDPVGAVLAVLVFEEVLAHAQSFDPFSASLMLLRTVAIGTGLGIAGGVLLAQSLRRFWLPDHLHGIGALSLALALFSLSNRFAEESGLITVTIMGIWLANQKKADIEHLIEFKEHLRTLLIGFLFILLGSRLEPMDLVALGLPGLAFLGVVILVIRPLSVFLSLPGTGLNWREQIFVALMAPRGIVAAAVSSVFALKLAGGGAAIAIESADRLVTVTFLVILGTVTFYGLLSGFAARLLGLAQPDPQGILIVGAEPWVRDVAKSLHNQSVPVLLVDANYNKVAAARMDGMTAECLNILSDHAREELNLGGVGRMLAMTPNDEVNSLAVREFRPILGRARVYQLAFKSQSASRRQQPSHSLRGRVLFDEKLTFSEFRDRMSAGAVLKTPKLTAEFAYDDFLKLYGNDVVLLFALNAEGGLQVNTTDKPVTPRAGDTVIALVSAMTIPANHAASPGRATPSPDDAPPDA